MSDLQLDLLGAPQKIITRDAFSILAEHEKRVRAIAKRSYVSYGGGRNSTAALIGMWSKGIRPDVILFADTGGEKPGTYAYLEIFDKWLIDHDFPGITTISRKSMDMVKHGRYESLEGQCLANKSLPSKAYGGSACSVSWKVEPLNKKIKQLWGDEIKAGIKPICYKGIHAGELKRFFGKTGQPHLEDSVSFNLFPLIYPFRWHQGHCEAVILGAGLPLPEKSACFFCPNSKKHEIVYLRETYPDLYERAIQIERTGLETGQTVAGLGRDWSWESLDSALPLFEEGSSVIPDCYCVDD